MNLFIQDHRFLNHLFRKDLLVSSVKLALIVGTLLNLINQYQPLIALDFDRISYWKFTLTYCVPFLVSIYSSANTHVKMQKGIEEKQ